MTELLCHQDSYLQAFEGTVARLDGDTGGVILDRTAFYPGGGGQPWDTGTLVIDGNEYAVTRVKKLGSDVLHFLDGENIRITPGARAQGKVDWERRYALMRTHTALHILCGVVFRDYGALVTGGEMEPLKGRMDFEFERLQKDLVEEIEAAANREVHAARDIRTSILPREEAFQIPDLIRTKINLLPEGISEVRTVEIIGLDLQADGGTHVRNTAEVGQVRVIDYKSKGAINKRIYLEVAK
ncbi:MAG: alanyl-tRNA editing protein [Chloroflexota bacterium]